MNTSGVFAIVFFVQDSAAQRVLPDLVELVKAPLSYS